MGLLPPDIPPAVAPTTGGVATHTSPVAVSRNTGSCWHAGLSAVKQYLMFASQSSVHDEKPTGQVVEPVSVHTNPSVRLELGPSFDVNGGVLGPEAPDTLVACHRCWFVSPTLAFCA